MYVGPGPEVPLVVQPVIFRNMATSYGAQGAMLGIVIKQRH